MFSEEGWVRGPLSEALPVESPPHPAEYVDALALPSPRARGEGAATGAAAAHFFVTHQDYELFISALLSLTMRSSPASGVVSPRITALMISRWVRQILTDWPPG
jgi:hypothetical protein